MDMHKLRHVKQGTLRKNNQNGLEVTDRYGEHNEDRFKMVIVNLWARPWTSRTDITSESVLG